MTAAIGNWPAFVLVVATLAACGHQPPAPASNTADSTAAFKGFPTGYLPKESLVDSLALLSPPPPAGTAAATADDDARRAAGRWRDTPRWTWAKRDAELRFPQAASAFACALGIPVSVEATPNLATLLQRTMADAGLATYRAKTHYMRTRPFVAAGESTCDPQLEAYLRKDGSYPSGHSAIGMTWALVLADLAPDRVDALLQRGIAFGQSRVICNAHWQSDVDAGRLVAAAVVAQLHTRPEFVAQLSAARAEVNAARTAGLRPGADCESETRELTQR
jgi:acid phosphatase (class A)